MPKRTFDAASLIPASQALPRWDALRRELWLGKILVKRFRVPADNQELLLTAFEEQDWTVRIDDPLPRDGIGDPSERLHGAIRRLNGRQATRLLRFSADGRGKGIFWELIAPGRR